MTWGSVSGLYLSPCAECRGRNHSKFSRLAIRQRIEGAGQGRAGQGRAGQGRAGQGRAGQGCFIQQLACPRPLTSFLTKCAHILAALFTSVCSWDVYMCIAQQ